MTIADLAKEMGVTESDVKGFVSALSVWIAKGYTFDQAIEKHMNQMTRLVNNSIELSQVAKPMAVDWFYEGETA